MVGSGGDVVRVQLDRRGKISHRLGQVALPAPEFAARVMNIGERRIEPKHAVVVGDGAVDHVLALIGAGARDQRLDAVGLFGLCVVDQRAAATHRPVVILRKASGKTRRRIDPQILDRLGPGRRCTMRNRHPQQRGRDQVADIGIASHQLIRKKHYRLLRDPSKRPAFSTSCLQISCSHENRFWPKRDLRET